MEQQNKTKKSRMVFNAYALHTARDVLVREYCTLGEAIRIIDSLLEHGQIAEETQPPAQDKTVQPANGG